MFSFKIKNYFFSILLLTINQFAIAQESNKVSDGYFGNPLNIPIQLSANFGAIRKEHFHMGLDIRTNQRENLPVFAVADGYISRIKVERYGYGRAIYIKHTNGYTSLYAHLNNFYDSLNIFVKQKQYAEEKWEQDIELQPNQFPVKKGQFIAFSGNTGASEGPHLHFEIRDENGLNVNPQTVGYDLQDNIAPTINEVFCYIPSASIYYSKEQGNVKPNSLLQINSDKIVLGFSSKDLMNNSTFKYGIAKAELWVDSVWQFGFDVNNFSYADTRYINVVLDYKRWYNTGKEIYLLNKLPGNKLNIYSNSNSGIIELNDSIIKHVEIIVKDVKGNTSSFSFQLQRKVEPVDKYISIAKNLIEPNKSNKIEVSQSLFECNENAAYDAFNLNIEEINDAGNAVSFIYQLPKDIPIHNNYSFTIPINEKFDTALKNKLVMYITNKSYSNYKVPNWNGNFASSTFNRFGDISLQLDTLAPSISKVGWNNSNSFTHHHTIVLKVKDHFSDVNKLKGYVDGKWVLFSRHFDNIYYEIDDSLSLGNHQLKIVAADEVGNINNFETDFTIVEKIEKPKTKKVIKKKSTSKSATTSKKKKKK